MQGGVNQLKNICPENVLSFTICSMIHAFVLLLAVLCMFCKTTTDLCFFMYLCVYASVYIQAVCVCARACAYDFKNKKHAAWPDLLICVLAPGK